MAKKGAVQQLQAEINTDEDFEKFMEREGLLVLDVYTEWCGPCVGMIGSLKKIKLELGGDNLHLAVGKSDTIRYLERFRNKSEPTWLFASHNKIVNCIFGTNVPQLMQVIADELILEERFKAGEYQRKFYEFTELTPLEQEQEDKRVAIENEKNRIETEAQNKRRTDYLTYVTSEIMERLGDAGVTLVMPNYAKERDIHKKLSDPGEKCGLTMKDRRVLAIKESDLEIILFELENPLPNEVYKKLFNEEILAVFWKTHDNELRDVSELMMNYVDMLCNPQPVMDETGNPEPELKIPPVYKPWKFDVSMTVYSEMSKEMRINEKAADSEVEIEPRTDTEVQCTVENTSPPDEEPLRTTADAASGAPEEEGTTDKFDENGIEIEKEVELEVVQGDPIENEEALLNIDNTIETVKNTTEKDCLPINVSKKNSVVTLEKTSEITATVNVPAIYAATNKRGNAALIYLYFRHLTDLFLPPDPVPEPPHVAVAYDAIKRRDVMELMTANPETVLTYGYFNGIDPDSATLLAKTHELYAERKPNVEDKLIVKVAKTANGILLSFVGLGPTYVSFSTEEGLVECKKFFPHGYTEDDEEDDTSSVGSNSSKKKKKKRKSKKEGSGSDIGISEVIAEENEEAIEEEAAENVEAVDGVEESILNDATGSPPNDDEADVSLVQDGSPLEANS